MSTISRIAVGKRSVVLLLAAALFIVALALEALAAARGLGAGARLGATGVTLALLIGYARLGRRDA